MRAGNTFCTLIVPNLHLKGVKQAAPADNVPEPPPAWVAPAVGEQMEVYIKDAVEDAEGVWCPAKVITVLAGGQFLMRIRSPDGDVWDDFGFTWENEGEDWKRPPLPLAADAVRGEEEEEDGYKALDCRTPGCKKRHSHFGLCTKDETIGQ